MTGLDKNFLFLNNLNPVDFRIVSEKENLEEVKGKE